jgi:hypothetical protein
MLIAVLHARKDTFMKILALKNVHPNFTQIKSLKLASLVIKIALLVTEVLKTIVYPAKKVQPKIR